MGRKRKDAITATFNIKKDVYERLSAASESSGMTKTSIVENGILLYIAQEEAKKQAYEKYMQ